MKHTMKAGDRIEGLHWRAEYHPNTHHIRVLREHSEVGTYIAPRTLFGDEHTMRAATSADRRCVESALRAYLRQFAKIHDAVFMSFEQRRRLAGACLALAGEPLRRRRPRPLP